jgi:hypothetical protein
LMVAEHMAADLGAGVVERLCGGLGGKGDA